MSASSSLRRKIAKKVAYHLDHFVIPRRLGYVTIDGGYRLNDHNVRQPDAAFISRARHPTLEKVEFPIAPELVVEVISPGEASSAILKKVHRYIYSGTQIVWVIYPEDKIVYVWTQAATGLN